jgi:hypothetical protein
MSAAAANTPTPKSGSGESQNVRDAHDDLPEKVKVDTPAWGRTRRFCHLRLEDVDAAGSECAVVTPDSAEFAAIRSMAKADDPPGPALQLGNGRFGGDHWPRRQGLNAQPTRIQNSGASMISHSRSRRDLALLGNINRAHRLAQQRIRARSCGCPANG